MLIIFLPYFWCRPARALWSSEAPGSLNRLNPRFLRHCALAAVTAIVGLSVGTFFDGLSKMTRAPGGESRLVC